MSFFSSMYDSLSGSVSFLASHVTLGFTFDFADLSGRPAFRSAGSNRLRIPHSNCQPSAPFSAIEHFRS